MFRMTIQKMIDKFTKDMESGWLKPDDIIGFEYWTYDDVRDFAMDNDYYRNVDDDIAREVWDDASSKLSRYEDIDRNVVRDEISWAFDKRIGGKNV